MGQSLIIRLFLAHRCSSRRERLFLFPFHVGLGLSLSHDHVLFVEDTDSHFVAYSLYSSLAFAGSENSAQLMGIGIDWTNCSFVEL